MRTSSTTSAPVFLTVAAQVPLPHVAGVARHSFLACAAGEEKHALTNAGTHDFNLAVEAHLQEILVGVRQWRVDHVEFMQEREFKASDNRAPHAEVG